MSERGPNYYSEIPRQPESDLSSWLSGIINPAKLERIREYPAIQGHSTEWIIMQALLAKLVETGPELDPYIITRLRNLVGILRILFYLNMTGREQEFMHDLVTKTTSVDFSSLRYEVTLEAQEDVQWLWQTFELQRPAGSALPSPITPLSLRLAAQLGIGESPGGATPGK